MSEVLADAGEAAAPVIEALRAGGLVVVPADHAYAVVADAFSPLATQRLLGAKRRSRAVPLTVVIRSPRQVTGLVEHVPEAAERLMAAYWPGPLTLVFRAADGLTWDLGETRGTVAIALPPDDLLIEVATDIGPLAWSGANRAGSPPPITVEEARAQLGDTVALYVDGGPRAGARSTIVEVTADEPRVLREGAIPAAHVDQVATGTTGWGERPGDTEREEEHPA